MAVRSWVQLFLIGLVLLASCSPQTATDKPIGADDPIATASPSPSPTGFVNGGDCPLAPNLRPPRAGCASILHADVDGDSKPDTVTVFATLGNDRHPRDWYVKLETADGHVAVQKFDAGNDFSYPRVAGAADVDGDGKDEVFAKVVDLASHGAPWQQVGMFVWRHESLVRATYVGEPLALGIGGITRMGEGVGCRRGRLLVLRAEAQDVHNVRWRYSVRVFELNGTRADLVKRTTGRLRLTDYNDPALDRFYRLDCGDVRYPF